MSVWRADISKQSRSWLHTTGLKRPPPPPFDPTTLGDPVAIETSWSPAKAGGSNFRTHRLVHQRPERVEFVATMGAKLVWGMFGVVGMLIVFFMVVGPFPEQQLGRLALLLMGVVFVMVAVQGLSQLLTPHVFDLRRSQYWKGRGEPSYSGRDEDAPVSLDSIYAVQLMPEWVRTQKASFYSYELNLVLADATRLAVIDHGNLKKIREDARELAEFLHKPFWDATEAEESDDE